MATNLLIRVDAGATIGAGHVMRCLALAQQWQSEGGQATFVCSELPGVFGDRLRSEGCDVVIIDAVVGSKEDAVATLNLTHGLDAVIVADGYRFSVDFQAAVHREARALVVVDDFGQIGSYCADIILDQNLGTTGSTYLIRPPDCRLLLGPDYVMLRREFLDRRRDHYEAGPAVRNVLVTTGGADVGGLATKIIDVANDIPETLDITVVVGGAGSGRGPLESRTRDSQHRIRLIENAVNMRELMGWADVAVGAAGSTFWELAYMGVPAVLGVVAENQRAGALALEACGAAAVFDGATLSATEELRQVLGSVINDQSRRSAMSIAAHRLLDGRGAARVVSAVTSAMD